MAIGLLLILVFAVLPPGCSCLCNNCTKKELWIGVFVTVDISDGGWSSAGVLPAIEMAIEDVNNDTEILVDYNLRMEWRDTKCKRGNGIKQLVDLIQLPRNKSPMMLIGGGCSIGTEATAEASHFWNLIQIAYSANSMALSDKKKMPLLFRTCYSESIGNPARIAFLKHFRWKKVATVVENEALFTLTMDHLRNLLDKENFTTLTSETLTNDPKYQIKNLKSKDARIIIGMFYTKAARKVFCREWVISPQHNPQSGEPGDHTSCGFYPSTCSEWVALPGVNTPADIALRVTETHKLPHHDKAYLEGMYGRKYQWLIPGWFDERWWENNDDESLECTPAQIKLAAGNYIAIMESTWSSDPGKTINGQTAAELNQRYYERVNKSSYKSNEYCVFGYDAVWAVALTMNKSIEALRAQGKSLEQFSYNDTVMSSLFKEKLQGLQYQGMSGKISFDTFGDRIGLVTVEQLQDNSEVKVGEYDSYRNVIRFNNNKLIWQGGSPPIDQTHVTKELISTSLPLMIIMTVFAVLGIILATGFLIFNSYYSDRRFIRMSSPRLNTITVIGSILIYFHVILSGFGDGKFVTPEQHSLVCQSEAWILCIGFTLAYGAMFSKTWRVHILFLKKIERRSIKDHQLLAMVAGFLFIDVIVMTTWQIVDPLHYTVKYLPVIQNEDSFSAEIPFIEYCSCEHSVKWKATILTYKGILLIFGAFLAWETRNVTIPALNDSKNIGISVYTVVLSCTVGLPVILVITDMPDFTYGLGSAICLICTTITLCLMFVPKVRMLGKPELEESSTQNERFHGVKHNTITPMESKTNSCSGTTKKESLSPEPSTAFNRIRKHSRVVQVKDLPNCENSTPEDRSGPIHTASEEKESSKD